MKDIPNHGESISTDLKLKETQEENYQCEEVRIEEAIIPAGK